MPGEKSPDLKRGYLPGVTPRPWKRGDPLTARHLDETRAAVAGLQRNIDPPQVVESSVVPTAVEVQRFVVVTVYGDYVACRRQGGDTSSDVSTEPSENIAKPYLLRRTPFDLLTRDSISFEYDGDISRTATNEDDDTEAQVVVPSYVAGDILFAARGIGGGTGVLTAPDTGDPVAVEWQDLNADGRAWAES